MPTVQTFEKFSDAVRWLSNYVQTDLPQLMAEVEEAKASPSAPPDAVSVGGLSLASLEEALAGVDDTKAVSPLGAREALNAALIPLGLLGSAYKNPSLPTFDLDDLRQAGKYFIEPAYYGNLLHLPFASSDFYLEVFGNAESTLYQRAVLGETEKTRFYAEGEGEEAGYSEWRVISRYFATVNEAKQGQREDVAVSPATLIGALEARIYPGSSGAAVNFPVGHTVLVAGSAARNAAVTVYLDSANGYAFTGSSKLTGSWAARGNTGSVTLAQRIA